MVLRALADLFVVHEIPATHLTPAGAAAQDHMILVVTSVSVNSCRSTESLSSSILQNTTSIEHLFGLIIKI